MRLEKWYADIVDDGRATILYCANLQLGPLCIGYRRTIGRGETESAQFRLGEARLPRIERTALVWPGPARLVWNGCASRAQELWNRGARTLTWNPLVLNGEVSGTRLSARARGYAERLTLEFGPWHLGLASLRWGRFCGSAHSLVWIEWQGRHDKCVGLLDGQACEVRMHGQDVHCGGARLTLGERTTLLQAPIAHFARYTAPLFAKAGALHFLRGTETKWLAQARLDFGGAEPDRGYAIHEEVVWPR